MFGRVQDKIQVEKYEAHAVGPGRFSFHHLKTPKIPSMKRKKIVLNFDSTPKTMNGRNFVQNLRVSLSRGFRKTSLSRNSPL